MSPKQYLDDVRIEHAKVLLESAYYTQAEIAARCGFDDVKYFRTAFKHHTGKTPGAYMKEHL
jgi:AraC-like DNA-binding protein